jgi:hypothetical protein
MARIKRIFAALQFTFEEGASSLTGKLSDANCLFLYSTDESALAQSRETSFMRIRKNHPCHS